MAQPSVAPAALKELAQLADDVWFLAGDDSVDPSWYTKRTSLSALYAASELYMTNDKSAEYQDTKDFLHRRLSHATELGLYIRAAEQWADFTARAGINLLRSKGLGI